MMILIPAKQEKWVNLSPYNMCDKQFIASQAWGGFILRIYARERTKTDALWSGSG